MKISHIIQFAVVAASISFLGHSSAYAFNLDGAWTTDVSACDKIFQKDKDGGISIIRGSNIYGDAFIARQDAIFNAVTKCTIKKRKDIGEMHHIVATCAASNVALSTFEFSYRVKNDDSIVRIFPGIEELNVPYHRCVK